MIYRLSGIALASLFFITQASAEIGRVPNVRGKTYISIEGGLQHSNGPSVAAHGDLSVTNDYNPDSAAAAAVFARPEFARAIRVNESPGANQINVETSSGGSVSISAASVTDHSHAETEVSADTLGFLQAFVDVFSDSSSDRATANAAGGPSIETDNSAYGGLTLGYGFINPVFNYFDRIEVYGTISRSDENKRVDGAAGAISVDGTSAFAATVIIPNGFTPTQQNIGPVTTTVAHSLDLTELGARLKSDRLNYDSAMLVNGLEGFYVAYDQDTSMRASIDGDIGNTDVGGIGSDFWRDTNIDADMFGMLVSLEAQKPITDTSVSLVGRVFGGLYHLNADGDFSDNFGVQNTSDDISKWGYRIGAEAGIRVDLSERLFLSLTGSVDHFSDVATAVLPQYATDPIEEAHIGTDELTNYKIGARLTFLF